jgi:DNA-binding LacI/PurR family transcriptional regulator
MDAAGLAVPAEYIHEISGGGPVDGLAGLEHFLALNDRPSALVCFNDMMAIGVLKGLQQAGIQVPNEFSVTGFDNIVFSAFTNPPLTTFDQPKRYIGAEAARLVLDLLNAPRTEDSSESHAPSQKRIGMISGSRDYLAPAGSRDYLAGNGTTAQPMVRMLKGRLLVRETTAPPSASSLRSAIGTTTRRS